MIRIIYYMLRKTNNPFALRCLTKLGNLLMPVYYRIAPPHLTDVNSNIVVSLTTFPKRISKVYLVVESMLRQSVRPRIIVLYLSKEQFGDTIENSKLPNSLLRLQKYGLKIVMVDGDLKSHKKYIYAIHEYPNDQIVTVDDDIMYNVDLIKNLLNVKKGDCIAANYVHEIKYDNNGDLKSYNDWPLGTIDSEYLSLGSGGGVMFTPRDFHKDVSNTSVLMSLAPKADDLWLTAMAQLGGSNIVYTGYSPKYLAISIQDNETLYSTNVKENDIQISSIINYYKTKYGIDVFHQKNDK